MVFLKVLADGYSRLLSDDRMEANCSCTLIRDDATTIIVDTMTPWDKDVILNRLAEQEVVPQQINFVISTHGHSDHCGNNNLFLDAVHMMGDNISVRDLYSFHNFAGMRRYSQSQFKERIS